MKSDIISIMRKNIEKVIMIVVIVVVAAVVSIISHYIYQHVYYIYTDDAKVTADLINISPQIDGKLMEFDEKEGDEVEKDQIIARQDSKNLEDSDIDQSLIRSPIDGMIVKKQASVGQNISPDKSIALVADPNSYYITANIDETKVSKIQKGQAVYITVDEYGRKKFTGKVSSIAKMSQSATKPSSYSSKGKYNRTVQKIAVNIQLDNPDNTKNKFILGENAKVKIRILK